MALYERGMVALSGDPFHNGHIDLIRTAAAKCKLLIVLVADNIGKIYLFDLPVRERMVRRGLAEAGISNVIVISDEGLAVDVYQREGCDAFFRGIRNEADEAYEKALAEVNRLLLDDVNVQMIKAEDPVLRTVSSSMVKEIGRHHGGLERFVPLFIKQMFEERALKQYLVAVTGCVATGKSTVVRGLVELAKEWGLPATSVNVDDLLRDLYSGQSQGAIDVRLKLRAAFGPGVLLYPKGPDGPHVVNRTVLASRLFDQQPDAPIQPHHVRVPAKLEIAREITQSHVRRLLRGELRRATGLVVVEWAQLAEMRMAGWMNNNVIVVDSPQREQMLAQRDIPAQRLEAMNVVQLPFMDKVRELMATVERDGHGSVQTFSNVRWENDAQLAVWRASLGELLRQTLALFPDLQKQTKPT